MFSSLLELTYTCLINQYIFVAHALSSPVVVAAPAAVVAAAVAAVLALLLLDVYFRILQSRWGWGRCRRSRSRSRWGWSRCRRSWSRSRLLHLPSLPLPSPSAAAAAVPAAAVAAVPVAPPAAHPVAAVPAAPVVVVAIEHLNRFVIVSYLLLLVQQRKLLDYHCSIRWSRRWSRWSRRRRRWRRRSRRRWSRSRRSRIIYFLFAHYAVAAVVAVAPSLW